MTYGLFQTTGEMCAKFGSERFRNVDLYKVQTNIQTFMTIYKVGSSSSEVGHKARSNRREGSTVFILTSEGVCMSYQF